MLRSCTRITLVDHWSARNAGVLWDMAALMQQHRCTSPWVFLCQSVFFSIIPRGLFQKRFKFKPQVGHHWVFKMYQHKETYRISNWVGLFVVVNGTIPIPCTGTLHLCLKVKWKHYSKEEQTYMNILSLSLCFYYITVYLIIVVFWCIFSILCKGMQRGEHQTKYVLKSEVRCEVSFLRGRSLSRIFFRTHGLKSSDSLNSTSRRSAYREAMVKQFLDVSWSTTCDTMSIMW